MPHPLHRQLIVLHRLDHIGSAERPPFLDARLGPSAPARVTFHVWVVAPGFRDCKLDPELPCLAKVAQTALCRLVQAAEEQLQSMEVEVGHLGNDGVGLDRGRSGYQSAELFVNRLADALQRQAADGVAWIEISRSGLGQSDTPIREAYLCEMATPTQLRHPILLDRARRPCSASQQACRGSLRPILLRRLPKDALD